MKAVFEGNLDMLKALIESNPEYDIVEQKNALDAKGNTAMHLATMRQHLHVIR